MAVIGILLAPDQRRNLFSPEDLRRLQDLGEVRLHQGEKPATVAEAIAVLRDCQVGIGSWGTPHIGQPELAAACPHLRLWEHVAGTVKHMFGPHLDGRDITIASCKTAIADCVAEMTVALIILGMRGYFPNIAGNRGNERKRGAIRTLHGQTVGIIGASEVGRRVLRLLRPYGARLLVADPFLSAGQAVELGASQCNDLVELCRQSLVVSLHTPYLPSTHHLLKTVHFQALADDAVLINTSRGACLDEAALIAELEKGRLTACLDVSDPEPAAADSPLRRLPNVHLSSHIAGPATRNLGRQAADDVAAFLAGGRPLAVVTRDMLERIA